MSKRLILRVIPSAIVAALLAASQLPVRAAAQALAAGPASAACDLQALSKAEAEFLRLATLRRFDQSAVSADELRYASTDYVIKSEACFQSLYGKMPQFIDDDGAWFTPDGSNPYRTGSDTGVATKWGAGSPYTGGINVPGPGLPGGTVTYSYMANGVDIVNGSNGEGGTPGLNVAISSLPTFSSCFYTEISNALAAWSAVANIQFMQVADNGVPFNAPGAAGDIRIGAHWFDGPSNVLAHGYYPPPNGTSAAGDVHFDSAENWTCNTAGIDIGIVATHEFGHAIGLNHEVTNPAIMQAYYNPSVTMPLADDINGASSIYGPGTNARELTIDFGSLYGIWILRYGVSWTQLNAMSPDSMVTGDMDGNGIDEVIVDFGPGYGIWVWYNHASWVQLHGLSPNFMAIGDLDGNGKKDIIIDFPGYGVYVRYNDATWLQLNAQNASRFATGNMDGTAGDELIIDFPGAGIWVWRNNSSWSQLHGANSTGIITGDFDANGKADVVINFPGQGIWKYANNATWTQVHALNGPHMAAGNVDANSADELVVDFGPSWGIWMLSNGSSWSQLHPSPCEDLIMGDLDGNGRSEITIDFGSGSGLWTWVNNASWVKLHSVSPEGMTIGNIY